MLINPIQIFKDLWTISKLRCHKGTASQTRGFEQCLLDENCKQSKFEYGTPPTVNEFREPTGVISIIYSEYLLLSYCFFA